MAGMLNIGLTGLNAAQLQLNTTSHNIANAGTPGFNRQGVVQSTNDPMFTGVGFFGQGTRIAGVTRQYSQLLENQVLSADNRRSEFATYAAQIGQINNLLADPSAGLAPTLQAFFAGVQEVAANPTNVAARQALLSSAESLVGRLQGMDARLTEIRAGAEGEIADSVELINNYAASIAELNQQILRAQSAGPAVPANDLLDQRNQLVAELNRYIRTTTVTERDGSLSVFIGSGQALVLGQQVTTLAAVPDGDDPTRLTVALLAPGGQAIPIPERLLTGGQLGGLLDFRRDSLDTAQNQLGLIALALAETFNAQHRLGQDLNGVLGADFFRSPSVVVRPTDGAAVSVDASSIGALTGSDYRLEFDGASYDLVRLSDGQRFTGVTQGDVVDGLRLDSLTLVAAGDSALIQPTRFAARDIAVALTDVRSIAAGNPVAVTVPLDNAGTGRVSDIVVRSVEGMQTTASDPFFPPFTLRFDAASNTLTGLSVLPDPVDPGALPAPGFYLADAGYDPATEGTGKSFSVLYWSGSEQAETFDFRLAGATADGDVFAFAASDRGVADNRNAVLLGTLQTARVLFSAGGEPTASLQSAYAQLVSGVGNKTREVQVGEQAQTTLLRQARDARDALSGVNLDEEAANLIRYQQAYQASGRVMAIAQRLFDELLSIAR
ncbi:flagellar hook-associated protein FlgK [Rhodocyclaceae bacterium SMB388]